MSNRTPLGPWKKCGFALIAVMISVSMITAMISGGGYIISLFVNHPLLTTSVALSTLAILISIIGPDDGNYYTKG